ISDFGTFVKLFSEAIETADNKPAEGVQSAGGNRLEVLRYGLVPQVLPVIAGQALYLFESNVRSSTIIGIVGAGGLKTRHAAMEAGERDVDYVFFGLTERAEDDDVHPRTLELAAWW
ncbi:hypothetical protein J8J17_20960, partial [Mycobacterium tuberculosis]|nr:hypothetical protein [Mycobacterium tuberculosis]